MKVKDLVELPVKECEFGPGMCIHCYKHFRGDCEIEHYNKAREEISNLEIPDQKLRDAGWVKLDSVVVDEEKIEGIIGGHAELDSPNPELATPVIYWRDFGKVAKAITTYINDKLGRKG